MVKETVGSLALGIRERESLPFPSHCPCLSRTRYVRAAYNWGLIEESMLKLIFKTIKKCLLKNVSDTFEESADLRLAC